MMMMNELSAKTHAPLSSGRRRCFIGIAVLVSFLLQFGVAWQLRAKIALGFSDFSIFYTAGKIIVTGEGSHLYDIATQESIEAAFTARSNANSFLLYNHAPYEAIFFAPLTLFSYSIAFWIWWACNVSLGYLFIYLLRPYLAGFNSRLEFAILGLGMFYPLLVAEIQGQDSILLLLLFTVCFVNLARGQAWLAGCALAFTTCKPPMALVMIAILVFVSDRRWRLLAGFLQTFLALVLLSIAVLGWHTVFGYPEFLAKLASGYDESRSYLDVMPNLRGLMHIIFGSHLSQHVFLFLLVALSAVLVFATIYALHGKALTPQGSYSGYALVVTVTVLVAYHDLMHDMTVLLLPLYLVWNSLAETGIRAWNRRLLAVCVPVLFCVIVIPILRSPLYAIVVLVFWAALYREVRGSRLLREEYRRPGTV